MRIREPVLRAIRQELVAAYPLEGCGFLLGEGGDGGLVVRRHLPAPNRRSGEPEAARRYLIAPDDYRAAERSAAATGLTVVGAYHSHPNAPAQPSRYDLEHAWPRYAYLIVSVAVGGAAEARAWRLEDDRSGFTELPLEIDGPGEE